MPRTKENGSKFVATVLNNGMKIVISADLWSKRGAALLGIVGHAILRKKTKAGKLKWVMVEKLLAEAKEEAGKKASRCGYEGTPCFAKRGSRGPQST